MKSIKAKSLIALVVVLVLIVAVAWWVQAAQSSGVIPFGGKITWVEYCCNGVAVTIGPPNPGEFLFTAGSVLHAYYNIFEAGPWALGIASPGGVCQEPALWCLPRPVEGTIIRVGTSDL